MLRSIHIMFRHPNFAFSRNAAAHYLLYIIIYQIFTGIKISKAVILYTYHAFPNGINSLIALL